MQLDDPVTKLDGVGPQLGLAYNRLGIKSLEDLINHYPRRYDDFSKITPICDLRLGQVSIKASISSLAGRYGRRGLHISQGLASDQTGAVALIWYNQPFRLRQFKPNQEYYLSGQYCFRQGRLFLSNPNVEAAGENLVQTARLRPSYPATKGLSNNQIRGHLSQLRPLVKEVPEYLPDYLTKAAQLKPFNQVLENLHFPENNQEKEVAQFNLGWRQMLVANLSGQLLKETLASETSARLEIDQDYLKELVNQLPFKLTKTQKEVLEEVVAGLGQARPIDNLIQGDVGCGKTVVAALIAAAVVRAGHQVALLAPTDILVRQHYETCLNILPQLTSRIALLVAKQPLAQRRQKLQGLADGSLGLVIGTHSLLSQPVDFFDLKLAIIDEQHRFGVNQRQALRQKGKKNQRPHCLSLSATPIPRSLQLVVYNDLKIHQISNNPFGRKNLTSQIIKKSQRDQLLKNLASRSKGGIFMVCPAIDSEQIGDSLKEVFELVKEHFEEAQIATIHSRLSSEEKTTALAALASGAKKVLLATTVVESGLDIAKAETIVIFSPEKFGLAQLHQLRGRVGRRGQPGTCYLALAKDGPPSERLEAILKYSDGFNLSEIDLKIRGPGAIYGTRQWGKLDLGFAPLTKPSELVKLSKIVEEFLDYLKSEKLSLATWPKLKKVVEETQAVVSL